MMDWHDRSREGDEMGTERDKEVIPSQGSISVERDWRKGKEEAGMSLGGERVREWLRWCGSSSQQLTDGECG